jgi:hypothetical protein
MSPPHFGKVISLELIWRIPRGYHSYFSAAPRCQQLQDATVGRLSDLQEPLFALAIAACDLHFDIEGFSTYRLLGFHLSYAVPGDVAQVAGIPIEFQRSIGHGRPLAEPFPQQIVFTLYIVFGVQSTRGRRNRNQARGGLAARGMSARQRCGW